MNEFSSPNHETESNATLADRVEAIRVHAEADGVVQIDEKAAIEDCNVGWGN